MTRQNVTDGPREVMTKKCPTCGGDGIVISEHTAAVDVERRLRALVTPGSRSKAFKVEVSSRIAAIVAGPAGSRLREIEEMTKRRFFLVGKPDEHLDHFRVLAQGTLEKVAPESPVQDGQELDLSLGEVGLYDAHAGVAKLDGIEIYVADAAKLVGKKVKARITLVTEGMAWAQLLSPVDAPPEPLTAEAEAEKPTRARRPTKAKPPAEDGEAPEPGAVEPEEQPDEEAPDASEEPGAAESAAAPPKKRTRRGTRGGRNRKKKTAATPAAGANGAEAPAAEPESQPAVIEPGASSNGEGDDEGGGPVIHVPDRALGTEDGDSDAPPRKRTRRGTRGGRNRKKKTAAVSAGAESAAEAAGETAVVEEATPETEREPEPAAVDRDEWGYTPMSEWGLDGE
jgi:ribonuclease G